MARYKPVSYNQALMVPVILEKQLVPDEGRQIYSERMMIVEPVFANIRTQKRMGYLTLRGKVKVNIQWLLYCIVHNIGKVACYGMEYG